MRKKCWVGTLFLAKVDVAFRGAKPMFHSLNWRSLALLLFPQILLCALSPTLGASLFICDVPATAGGCVNGTSSPESWATDETLLRIHILPVLGHLTLDQIAGEHMPGLINDMRAKG